MAASFGLCILCSGVKKVLVTQKAFKEEASADQPETIRARFVQIQVQVMAFLFFLAAITNTIVYQKKTLHVVESK